MLCCLLAGLLAFAGVKGRRSGRAAAGLAALGACCGALAFEVVAALAGATGGLRTTRPEVLLVGSAAVTAAGVVLVRRSGVPAGPRAWALFALSFSGGSAVAELVDLHLLRLHRGPDLAATTMLHGLSVVAGLLAARLLLQANRGRRAAPIRTGKRRPVAAKAVQADSAA